MNGMIGYMQVQCQQAHLKLILMKPTVTSTANAHCTNLQGCLCPALQGVYSLVCSFSLSSPCVHMHNNKHCYCLCTCIVNIIGLGVFVRRRHYTVDRQTVRDESALEQVVHLLFSIPCLGFKCSDSTRYWKNIAIVVEIGRTWRWEKIVERYSHSSG